MFKKPCMDKFRSRRPIVSVPCSRVNLKYSPLYKASVSERGVPARDIMQVFESVWCNDTLDKYDDED